MDSFELNKIIGAILGTLLFVMGVGFLAEAIYAPAHRHGPRLRPARAGRDHGHRGRLPAARRPRRVDIGTLLASADAKAGEASAKKCQSCHDFSEGGPNKTGPDLYDVVGARSPAIRALPIQRRAQGACQGDTWTYENLNHWLTSPKAFAPGTKMTFAGDQGRQGTRQHHRLSVDAVAFARSRSRPRQPRQLRRRPRARHPPPRAKPLLPRPPPRRPQLRPRPRPHPRPRRLRRPRLRPARPRRPPRANRPPRARRRPPRSKSGVACDIDRSEPRPQARLFRFGDTP